MNAASVVTCEHASNAVPPAARALFAGQTALLATHRAYDIGADACARAVARRLRAPLVLGRATRLLVDLNRRADHRACFSRFSRTLPPAERRRLLDRFHRPYRDHAAALVRSRLKAAGFVVHLSMHSFTPVLGGRLRREDIGVLYDPARASERRLAPLMIATLRRRFPGWRIAANRPYRGVSDGLTAHFRTLFPVRGYAGFEIEVSQKRLTPRRRARIARRLADALAEALPRRSDSK